MDFQPYMVVQFAFLAMMALFIGYEVRYSSNTHNNREKRITYLTLTFLLIGIIVRSVNLAYPLGVYVDESMGAYDSWSLANYGVDSNLASYPVYLKSWGTGQSALYAYAALPFIKLLGLNAEAYRLPASLIGCFSLIFFYYTLRKTQKSVSLVAVCTFFLAISPWHIMKSRFGLDCNICPDMILIAACFFLLYLHSCNNKRFWFLLFGFIFLYLAAYAYGVSWLMLPVFYICIIIYLIKSRKSDQRKIIYTAISSILLLIPLILFAVVLFFKLDIIKLGPLTIPVLNEGRHNHTMNPIGDLNLAIIYNYIKSAVKIVILGSDYYSGDIMNAISPYGTFYNAFTIIFTVIGIYSAYRKKGSLNTIFGLWLLACIPIIILVTPSVWHWNILWFPLIYFSAYGIWIAIEYKKIFALSIPIYIIIFGCFLRFYFNKEKNSPFYSWTYENEMKFIRTINPSKVYYPWEFTQGEILFYNPISPYVFANTRIDRGEGIKIAKSFDNAVIGLPNNMEPTPKTAYLIPNVTLQYIDRKQFKIKQGKYYSVIWND